MHKFCIITSTIILASVLIIPASSTSSVFALNPFEEVKRVELKTESGKVYKFDVDIRLDGTDDGNIVTVNHKAKGDKVTLKQGEHITLRVVQSGIVNDEIFGSFFDGKINIKEGLKGKIQFKGKEITFLNDDYPEDNIIHATVPSKLKKGDYKLIVNIDEGGELIFYFITSAKIKSGTGSSNNCDPAYPDFCIKSPPPDLDCADFTQKNFKALPPDPHKLDGDGDGVACEG